MVSRISRHRDRPSKLQRTALDAGSGPEVVAAFPEDTKYFGDPKNIWMINFRVRDLDAMAAQLRSAGIYIEMDPERYPNGRFARLYDPEGNPIELWQPQGRDAP